MIEPHADTLSWIRLAVTPGVGPLMGTRLLGRFNNLERLFEASVAELRGVEGVGEKVANSIRDKKYADAAARVLDNDLADYDSACRYYYMTSKIHESTSARKKALKRLRTLQEVGYGSDFVEAAAEAQAEKKENK